MTRKPSLLVALLMGMGMISASPVYATSSWSFTAPPSGATVTCTGQNAYVYGNNCKDAVSGQATLTATAYANTGGTKNGATGTAPNIIPTAATGTLQQANLELYSLGLGVTNQAINETTTAGQTITKTSTGTTTTGTVGATTATTTSTLWNNTDTGETLGTAPEHAIDNQQYVDSVELAFSSSTALSSVTVGWNALTDMSGYSTSNADFDVLAYTGGGTGAPVMTGSYASLLSSGWVLVGQYANLGDNTVTVNAGGVSSSYWLVTADMSWGAGHLALTNTSGNDYFKIASVAGTPKKIPEPGSLALLGMGGLLLLRIRKSPKA